MSIVSGIVVFLMIWWTALFAVLPWGVRSVHEGDESDVVEYGAAPQNPKLARKFAITTGVAVLIWLVIYGLIEAEVISFFDVANQMIEEDRTR